MVTDANLRDKKRRVKVATKMWVNHLQSQYKHYFVVRLNSGERDIGHSILK